MIPGIEIPRNFSEISEKYHKFPVMIVVGICNIEEIKKEKPEWLRKAEQQEIEKLRKETKIGQGIDLYI